MDDQEDNKPEEQNDKSDKSDLKEKEESKGKEKKDKNEKKKKKAKDEIEKKSQLYVYFIENHLHNCPAKIEIAETKFAKGLERMTIGEFEKDDYEFIYTIFRFKFLPQEKDVKDEVTINLIDENNNKFSTKVSVKEYDRDIFIYDIKFNPFHNRLFKYFDPPKSHNLSHQEQFNYYIELIRNELNLAQDSNENLSLILSTQKLLMKEGAKYELSFYIMIFLECYACPAIKNHLMIFNPDKFEEAENEDPEKIKLSNNLNQIIKDKNKSLKYINIIEDENEKEKCNINFYTIFLYYNYLYNKEKFKEFLDNKEYENNIYNALLSYEKLFKKEILSDEQFKILLDKVPNYSQLSNALIYNHGILNLFQLIKKNFDKIAELYGIAEKELKSKTKKKNLVIKIETIIISKKK